MKKIAIIAAALVTLFVAGCEDPESSGNAGPDQPSTGSSETEEIKQRLSDGRTVTCLQDTVYKRGGLSCDWANAK